MEQRIQQFYIGGAPELQDVGFVRYPVSGPYNDGIKQPPLVKIGAPAEVTGWLRVSTHVAVHYSDLCASSAGNLLQLVMLRFEELAAPGS